MSVAGGRWRTLPWIATMRSPRCSPAAMPALSACSEETRAYMHVHVCDMCIYAHVHVHAPHSIDSTDSTASTDSAAFANY